MSEGADGLYLPKLLQRQREFHNGLVIRSDFKLCGETTGGDVWLSSLALATLLSYLGICGPGVRVIELGAGTGYLGLVLALSGAKVLLTDVPDQIGLLESNVESNIAHLERAGGSVRVASLDWGMAPSDDVITKTFDVVVGSECLYEDEHVEQILKTVKTLMDKCSAKCFYYAMQLDRMGSDRYFSELTSLASAQPYDLRVQHLRPSSVFHDGPCAISPECLRRNALNFVMFEKK